jgi:hypothetical protein
MIGARIVFGEPEEFGLHAVLRFRGSPCPLEDVSLRNMKSGEIGGPRRIFIGADRQRQIGSGKHNPCLIQESDRPGFHKSRPSRLISCISGVRSR